MLGLGKLKSYIIGLYPVEKVFIYYISNSKLVFRSKRFDAVLGGFHLQGKTISLFSWSANIIYMGNNSISWEKIPPSSKNIHQCCYNGINTNTYNFYPSAYLQFKCFFCISCKIIYRPCTTIEHSRKVFVF